MNRTESKLRQIRKAKKVSGTHLAKCLGFQTCSGYFNIEYGRNRLTLDQAAIIAKELGVSVEDLREDKELFFTQKQHVVCRKDASA